MPLKLNRSQRDYLYWLWPVIFMVLAFIAVKLDKHNNPTATPRDSGIKVDSSIVISAQMEEFLF